MPERIEGMDNGVTRIREMLKAHHAPVVVGVTGAVGAGKSTLASALSACVIPTDMYLPDYELTPEHQRDLPELSDLMQLSRDLMNLRAGRTTRIPVWSFQSHRREGSREVAPGNVIVVEGLHALATPVLAALQVRVVVEAAAGQRWNRWERLESTGERGWGVAYAREFFDRVAEPTFARFAPAYLAAADVVIVNHDR